MTVWLAPVARLVPACMRHAELLTPDMVAGASIAAADVSAESIAEGPKAGKVVLASLQLFLLTLLYSVCSYVNIRMRVFRRLSSTTHPPQGRTYKYVLYSTIASKTRAQLTFSALVRRGRNGGVGAGGDGVEGRGERRRVAEADQGRELGRRHVGPRASVRHRMLPPRPALGRRRRRGRERVRSPAPAGLRAATAQG